MSRFAPTFLSSDSPVEPEKPIYSSGYSSQQEEEIKIRHKILSERDLTKQPVTLAELRDIVIPFQRINRTEAFIINKKEEKPKKEKIPKEPKPPKEKKMTKKAIKEKKDSLIMSFMSGEVINDEDKQWFFEQTGEMLE